MNKHGKGGKDFHKNSEIQKRKLEKALFPKGISLSSLIINSVENRIFDDERRKVMAFIEKQDNVFIKIETNINQVARM